MQLDLSAWCRPCSVTAAVPLAGKMATRMAQIPNSPAPVLSVAKPVHKVTIGYIVQESAVAREWMFRLQRALRCFVFRYMHMHFDHVYMSAAL